MKTHVFQDGESQAVVIPEEYRICEADVMITKVGDSVVLRPVSPARARFLQALEMFPFDFFEDGRVDAGEQEREEIWK